MFIYSHHITPTKSKCQLSQLNNQINQIEPKKKIYIYQIEYQSKVTATSSCVLPPRLLPFFLHTLFCLHCLCLCFLHTICSFPTIYNYTILQYNVAYQFLLAFVVLTHVSLPQHSQKTILYFLYTSKKVPNHLKLYNYRTFQSLLSIKHKLGICEHSCSSIKIAKFIVIDHHLKINRFELLFRIDCTIDHQPYRLLFSFSGTSSTTTRSILAHTAHNTPPP